MEVKAAREFDQKSLEDLLGKAIFRKGFMKEELEGFSNEELFEMKRLISERIDDLRMTHERRSVSKKVLVVLADGLFNQDFEGWVEARWLEMMITELDEQIVARGLTSKEEDWG